MISHLPKQINEELERHHFYETHWKRTALELLARSWDGVEGASLLDYGSGRGETLSIAGQLGMVATGTDLDRECVELSKRHGDSVLLTEPDRPIKQFGANSFDVVACLHVLEHVVRPSEVLFDLAQIARHFVLVAVPNLRPLPRPSHFRQEPCAVNEGHLQGWDHQHFRNLAERHCGLEVMAWGHDHCKVPVFGELVRKVAGEGSLIRLETGFFCRLFPFHSASIIALMKPKGSV